MSVARQIGFLADLHFNGNPKDLCRFRADLGWLRNRGAELAVVLGDLLDAEGEAQAQVLLGELRDTAARCGLPVRWLPGNHDLDHLSKAQFYEALGLAGALSVESFRCGETTFVQLDANFSPDGLVYGHGNCDWRESYLPADQLDWLDSVLRSVDAPVAILIHQRLDGEGPHTVTNAADVRAILCRYANVSVVFQGHRHKSIRQQIGGIEYITLPAFKHGAPPCLSLFE